jgi:WD repeat-containing protein 19
VSLTLCQRSGLKSTAFEYASLLMRPEYRSGISEQYRAKIEKIVRKPEKVGSPAKQRG